MDGITMSMDGIPALEGTKWWKRDGSSHFVVRDVVSDGSQMIVRTTNGQMIPFDRLNDYIQSETPIKIPKVDPLMGKIKLGDLDGGVSIDEPNKKPAFDVTDGLLEEDMYLNEQPEPIIPEYKPKKPNNYDIIDKAMSKVAQPTIEANIRWIDYPNREFELLQDIMDIPAADIAEYIYHKWFDGKLKDMVVAQIKLDLGVEE